MLGCTATPLGIESTESVLAEPGSTGYPIWSALRALLLASSFIRLYGLLIGIWLGIGYATNYEQCT